MELKSQDQDKVKVIVIVEIAQNGYSDGGKEALQMKHGIMLGMLQMQIHLMGVKKGIVGGYLDRVRGD